CFLKPQTTPILHTSILISIEEPVHSADLNKKTRAVVRRGANRRRSGKWKQHHGTYRTTALIKVRPQVLRYFTWILPQAFFDDGHTGRARQRPAGSLKLEIIARNCASFRTLASRDLVH
ncbi:MAG: hypothetical protein WBC86_23420, partial [Pseudolabrys sp.]